MTAATNRETVEKWKRAGADSVIRPITHGALVKSAFKKGTEGINVPAKVML